MSSRRFRSTLLAIAALVCASPCAAQAPEVMIEQSAAGSTVALRREQRLTVRLQGNPTTGFVWERAPATESILAQRGDPEFTPDSGNLGAGGVYSFTFQATRCGSEPLTLIYHRRFEKDVAPVRTFEVTVEVTQ